MTRNILAALTLAAVVVAGGRIYAQPAGDADGKPDVVQPMGTEAKLSPREMTAKSESLVSRLKDTLRRVLMLQRSARKQNDIIKLNCVNDKLVQVKQLLNIAESARNDMAEAISNRDEPGRYHQFGRVTVAADNGSVLRSEAEACIGEELAFIGDSELVVEGDDSQDDPTTEDPFANPIDYDDVIVASPFK